MYYFLTPLNTHVDFGLGATGDAFKVAADKLEESLLMNVLNERLPINYLRRHAIELYLKSIVVIIHRSLSLCDKDIPASDCPYAFVLIKGKRKPLSHLHSVEALWAYVKILFKDHKPFFDSFERVDWTLPSDVDDWIQEIERWDPKGTFFRYPNVRIPEDDAEKPIMKEFDPVEIEGKMTEGSEGRLFLLLENDVGEVTRSYCSGEDDLLKISQVLKQCIEVFFGVHAAFRFEICGGS